MEFKVLTEAEIKELSRRGRALLKSTDARELYIGQVMIERFLDTDDWGGRQNDGYCMGIYWDHGSRLSECHMENQVGHLMGEGEEFAARRALKVLRAHMALDDLAGI